MTSLRGRHHPDDFYEDRKNHSGRGRASRADLSKAHSRDHHRRIKPLMPELNEVCGADVEKKKKKILHLKYASHFINARLG